MNNNYKNFFLFIGFILILLSGLAIQKTSVYNDDMPCYDSKGQIINELTCKGKTTNNYFILPLLLGAIFIISGIGLYYTTD